MSQQQRVAHRIDFINDQAEETDKETLSSGTKGSSDKSSSASESGEDAS